MTSSLITLPQRSLNMFAAACCLLLCLGAAPPAVAQETVQQDSGERVITAGEELIFGSDVSVVTVPVTVTDGKDKYVDGLEMGDFKILDNGAPQKIDSFEVAFLPISLVICIQSSSRVEGILSDIQNTAILFTDMVLGEFGQAAVIAFDQRVRLLQDFTADNKEIEKALKGLTLGSDAVRLSDAVYEGIRMLDKRPSSHRKVIIAISESQETASVVHLGETMRTMQIKEIMFYALHLSSLKGWLKRDDKPIPPTTPPGIQARASIPGTVDTPTAQMQHNVRATPNMIPIVIDLVRGVKNLIFNNPLELMVEGTGGKGFSPDNEDEVQKALMGIGEDLRSQYLLSYRPTNLNDSGIFHRIEVEVPYEEFKVRARPGYWQGPAPVPTGEPAEPAPAK